MAVAEFGSITGYF